MTHTGPQPPGVVPTNAAGIPSIPLATAAIAVAALSGAGLAWGGFTPLASWVLAIAAGLAAAAFGVALLWATRRLLWACRWRLERAVTAAVERALAHPSRAGVADLGAGSRTDGDTAPSLAEIAAAIASLRMDLAGIERRLGETLARARYEIEEGTAILVDLADRAEGHSDSGSGG